MGWNYRLMAKEYENGTVVIEMKEVYYDKKGKPNGYTDTQINTSHIEIYESINETFTNDDPVKEISETLDMMKLACSKPILYMEDKFPQEYKLEENGK